MFTSLQSKSCSIERNDFEINVLDFKKKNFMQMVASKHLNSQTATDISKYFLLFGTIFRTTFAEKKRKLSIELPFK